MMSIKIPTFIPSLIFGFLSIQVAPSQSLENWQFNDPAETPLAKLHNAAGSTHFDNASTAKTDGKGHLKITQSSSENLYRSAPISIGPQKKGTFEIRWKISSLTFNNGADTGANFGIVARSSPNKSLFIVRLHKSKNSYALQTRIGSDIVELHNFGSVNNGPIKNLSIRAVFNLNTHTMNVFWQLGEDPPAQALHIKIEKFMFSHLKLMANIKSDVFGKDDELLIDYISLHHATTGQGTGAVVGIGGLSFILTAVKNEQK